MAMDARRGGILLHITSLPGAEAAGTLGKDAYRFVDFLREAGMRVWQVLPVGPTGYGESPYQSACAMAGNPLLIDIQTLRKEGLLPPGGAPDAPETDRADFETLRREKETLLRKAFAHERERLARADAYAQWEQKWPWLRDYALFMAIKSRFGGVSWMDWPDADIRLRRPDALRRYGAELREDVRYHMFTQYVFFKQWSALREYAHRQGVQIFGDMPIYVAEDSSDVWANARYFQLDKQRRPVRVAGVPPDYFSADGQLWGNPLYNWRRLRLHGYDFWMKRLRAMEELYDILRIDHFIGFANYYAIAAGAKTARVGKWVIGPGKAFFRRVKRELPQMRVVAEDLGAVNERVKRLLAYCGYPGMKVLQFGLEGGENNLNAPETITENCVAYTGTHDNDTSLGWWRARDDAQRAQAIGLLGGAQDAPPVWRMVETVFASRANTAIAPMQDVLALDSSHRMNLPGTVGDKNWRYRARRGDFTPELSARLRALNMHTGRLETE